MILFTFIGFKAELEEELMIKPDYTNKCPNETTLILSVRLYDEAPAISILSKTH
jgi:hypothetical protein